MWKKNLTSCEIWNHTTLLPPPKELLFYSTTLLWDLTPLVTASHTKHLLLTLVSKHFLQMPQVRSFFNLP